MHIRSRISVFVAVLLLAGQTLYGQSLYYPDSVWQVKKPEALRMNPRVLDSAVAFAVENETQTDTDLRIANLKASANEPFYKIVGPMRPRGKPAGLILKSGYIVAQWGNVDRVDMAFSATKSFLSTMAGLAADSRLIQSVDDPVRQYVWDEKFEGPHNGSITWRHLLTQSSDWSGCLFDQCDWADRPPKDGNMEDWEKRKLLAPGSQFEYNDVRVNLLAYALLQVWRKPLPAVLKEKIMDPIGASTTWRWYGYENSFVNMDGLMMQSVSGGGHFGGGLFINTRDMARYGLVFLRNGRWQQRQLLSASWIAAARKPSALNPSYGFLWWTNAENKLGAVSKNIYYAEGFGGNFIVVDQEHDLVLTARWLDPSKIGELVRMLIRAAEK